MRKLIVVESPAKTRTIQNILGSDFQVIASNGHIIDLPKGSMGVFIDDDGVRIKYIELPEKKQTIDKLKKHIEESSEIFLATDPDREGEAIAYDISKLNSKKQYKRVLFNEITEHGITEGMKGIKEIDLDLVHSQHARRILDRIVGYKLSPFLWAKIKKGLSAGRVQSVALRIVCERETEIRAFVCEKYWEIFADFDIAPGINFKLEKYKGKKLILKSEKTLNEILKDLRGQKSHSVSRIIVKEKKLTPPRPFITSTLQQDAAKKFNWPPKKTMQIAQKLYEGLEINGKLRGLITYMRTDSVRISEEAKKQAKGFIETGFGKEYVGNYSVKNKSGTKIQDAHEAVRPTSLDLDPENIRTHVKSDEHKLYKLIYKRFLASQMSYGIDEVQTVNIETENGVFSFEKNFTRVKFKGFRTVYQTDEELKDSFLDLKKGMSVKMLELKNEEKETQPLPRYTQGTLIKQLEEKGIGRPSTYASILSTLLDRGYVEIKERQLVPIELGEIVNELLIKGFEQIINYGFTKEIEEELDLIEEGKANYEDVIVKYWKMVLNELGSAYENIDSVKNALLEKTGKICPLCGGELVYRDGRFGRFISCLNYPECKHKENITEESDVKCPKCLSKMEVRTGKWGKYLKCTDEKCGNNIPFSKGVKCPKCGKLIYEKRSKNKKNYYVCEDKGKGCDFIVFNEPREGECIKCKANILLRSGAKYKCFSCGNIQDTEKGK